MRAEVCGSEAGYLSGGIKDFEANDNCCCHIFLYVLKFYMLIRILGDGYAGS